MYQETRARQMEWEFVCIDELVPQDHFLRQVDEHIDFSFIYDMVKDYYCPNNGRPALDPVFLFKMMFIGYFYGIRSERQLEKEINGNIYYRWFLGLGLKGKAPDHSTISFNRHKRFGGTTAFQDIFDKIVELAMRHRMVAGRVLISDSTHLKANANKKKFDIKKIDVTPKSYLEELDAAIAQDREAHGKKP